MHVDMWDPDQQQIQAELVDQVECTVVAVPATSSAIGKKREKSSVSFRSHHYFNKK